MLQLTSNINLQLVFQSMYIYCKINENVFESC